MQCGRDVGVYLALRSGAGAERLLGFTPRRGFALHLLPIDCMRDTVTDVSVSCRRSRNGTQRFRNAGWLQRSTWGTATPHAQQPVPKELLSKLRGHLQRCLPHVQRACQLEACDQQYMHAYFCTPTPGLINWAIDSHRPAVGLCKHICVSAKL